MAVFVRVRQHPRQSWGVGKVTETATAKCVVTWFDSPLTEPHSEYIPTVALERITLEPQSRVYWLDPTAGVWRVGRVLDADTEVALVRFPNAEDHRLPTDVLQVRWDRPVADPCAFLAERICESPAFAEARTGFARALIAQRGASGGMSGLISSVIALEPHQVEVIRRVLQDPVQRYLLADEVGLGKTIEAGVLIRQYVLDNPHGHRVLVLTPPALVVQWQRELRTRFLLGYLLGDSIRVLPLDAGPERLLEQVRWAAMVIIDEAHHLSRDPTLYQTLRGAIAAAPRLLLLSATPVLHNERGFLEMLHLLDPDVFPLADEAAFRKRIQHRQGLAEAVAGLVPENLLQIEVYLDDLAVRFPDDAGLGSLMDPLRAIARALPDESDPALLDALAALRAHLTETYRLDRRILRNRRRDLSFLTPKRAGLTRIRYRCAATARLVQACEAWRTATAASVFGREASEEARGLARWCHQMVEALLSDPADVTDLAGSGVGGAPDAPELLAELARAAREVQQSDERMQALLAAVREALAGRAKLVIFCSRPGVADAVAGFLTAALPQPVDRHLPLVGDADQEQPWERFCSRPEHRVLVCDAAAEEGINLQGGAKVVIHYDLPLAPNRIEQRLGRTDRYGSADPIRSIALCCADDPYATAWADYLETGLGVFDRSIASLQYLIDDELRVLADALLCEGIDAPRALTARTAGPQGTAARELRRIEDQDALDALSVTEDGGLAELEAMDSDWREIAASLRSWLTDTLQVETESDPPARGPGWFGYDPFRFCFRYQDGGQRTLIPLRRILSVLVGLLDLEAPGASPKRLKTCWYSCRRPSTQAVGGIPEGLRLVRWGDELVDRIQQLMDLDDRGRAAAMWRLVPDHVPQTEAAADLYLRFDFIVETDIGQALRVAGESDEPGCRAALTRRGDMALPPFYHRVWIDETQSPVVDPVLLARLDAPYLRATAAGPYRDWNLNWERWPLVEDRDLPVMGAWRQWLPRARQAAEAILHSERDMAQLCEQAVARAQWVDQRRFAQLRARVRGGVSADSNTTLALLEREERIARGLYAGMRAPRVTLGTVVAVFLSAQPLVRQDG